MAVWFSLGLDILEMVMVVEERFELDPTVSESAPTAKGWTHGKVWATLCAVIHQQLKVPKRKIHFDAHFAKDLGMD